MDSSFPEPVYRGFPPARAAGVHGHSPRAQVSCSAPAERPDRLRSRV